VLGDVVSERDEVRDLVQSIADWRDCLAFRTQSPVLSAIDDLATPRRTGADRIPEVSIERPFVFAGFQQARGVATRLTGVISSHLRERRVGPLDRSRGVGDYGCVWGGLQSCRQDPQIWVCERRRLTSAVVWHCRTGFVDNRILIRHAILREFRSPLGCASSAPLGPLSAPGRSPTLSFSDGHFHHSKFAMEGLEATLKRKTFSASKTGFAIDTDVVAVILDR